MKKLLLLSVIFLCQLIVYSQSTEDQKIVANDRTQFDSFGSSVSVDENFAVVGAFGKSGPAGTSMGAAYVYEKNNNGSWSQIQKLLASDGVAYDLFGSGVAISGDHIAVGAFAADNPSGLRTGAAYIFKRNSNGNWIQIQKILASDGRNGDDFGRSISISGNYMIIGAHRHFSANGVPGPGAAYIFEKQGNGIWTEVKKIMSSDGSNGSNFGFSVSMDGNKAAVGAWWQNDPGTFLAGAAYIFERNNSGNWNQTQKIVASDGADNDYFGRSVGIDGNYVVVGSYWADDPIDGNETGAAYVFKRNTSGNWNQTVKLTASDADSLNFFGSAVDISGDYIIVGADHEVPLNSTPNGLGSAYFFEKDAGGNWNEVQKLVASDGALRDDFGGIVSMSGEDIIIGALWQDTDASGHNFKDGAGAAYIFDAENLGCPIDLFITQNVSGGSEDFQEASNTITATNIIFNGALAEYDAGVRVFLKPGFNARAGSDFRAYIDGCVSGGSNATSNNDGGIAAKNIADEGIDQFYAFKIYPNPTREILFIESSIAIKNWRLINSIGRTMEINLSKYDIGNRHRLNFQSLPPGMYFLNVMLIDGTVVTKKFFKE